MKVYQPGRTVLTDTPWCSLTFIFDDRELTPIGHGVCVVACHVCGDVALIQYDVGLEKNVADPGHGHPVLRAKRDEFQAAHVKCCPSPSGSSGSRV